MPPRRKPVVAQPVENKSVDSSSDSDSDVEVKTVTKFEASSRPMLIVSNSSDNDRVKLANAINNLTIRSGDLIEAMRGFDSFRESIARLDIEIDTKKQESKEVLASLETRQKDRLKEMEQEYKDKHQEMLNKYNDMAKEQTQKYNDMTRTLNEKYQDLSKKLESEHNDRSTNLNNDFKNNQITVKQRLSEFKVKACDEFAKENGMMLVKQEDYAAITAARQKTQQEYDELKKTFDSQCNAVKKEELARYTTLLKNETSMLELTHKANNADVKAQVEQQKREITVLHETITSLKSELSEQRNLTKEVAQASSKSQITQKFGKDN